MNNIIKLTIPMLATLAVILCSCKKESSNDNSILNRMSGIWRSDMAGAPMIYIIANEEFASYFCTYSYPVDEQDQEAGLIVLEGNKITFINLTNDTQTEYTYTLSNNDNSLVLTSQGGAMVVYTRQDNVDEQS